MRDTVNQATVVTNLEDRTPRIKINLYYSLDCDENLQTHVNSKIKWANRYELFSIFFIETELFTKNVNRGVRGNKPNGRTVQPKQLILI